MDKETRENLLRVAEDLIEAEMRDTNESLLLSYWNDYLPDAYTGHWSLTKNLCEVEFDGNISLIKHLWSDHRVQQIDSGADPTDDELKRTEYASRAVKEMWDNTSCFTIPIFASSGTKG